MKANWKIALLGSGAAVALMAATPAFADDINDLRSQISSMQDKIAKLEADRAQKRRVAAAAAVEAGDKPKTWKLPGTNTSMNIGGYTKADFNYTFNGNGNANSYDATNANIRGASNGRLQENIFRFVARQSRIWFKTWTPTDWGELGTHIEADFYGSGNKTLRMRHAYGYLGPVLAGQTWNVFQPLFAGPPSLDFGGPVGVLGLSRTPQIRYTHQFGQGTVMKVALSTPGAGDLSGRGVFQQRLPDLEFSLDHSFKGGKVWIGGVLGMITVDEPGVGRHSKFKWGVSVAGTYEVGKIVFGGQFTLGKGIGNYLAGSANSGNLDTNADGSSELKLALTLGGSAFVQYQVTDTIAAYVSYGFVYTDVGETVSLGKSGSTGQGEVQNAHTFMVGMEWNPVPQVSFGIEYAHGFTARYNLGNGFWDRLQASAKYKF